MVSSNPSREQLSGIRQWLLGTLEAGFSLEAVPQLESLISDGGIANQLMGIVCVGIEKPLIKMSIQCLSILAEILTKFQLFELISNYLNLLKSFENFWSSIISIIHSTEESGMSRIQSIGLLVKAFTLNTPEAGSTVDWPPRVFDSNTLDSCISLLMSTGGDPGNNLIQFIHLNFVHNKNNFIFKIKNNSKLIFILIEISSQFKFKNSSLIYELIDLNSNTIYPELVTLIS